MKAKLYFLLLIPVIISCSKDDESSNCPEPAAEPYYISFEIDGVTLTDTLPPNSYNTPLEQNSGDVCYYSYGRSAYIQENNVKHEFQLNFNKYLDSDDCEDRTNFYNAFQEGPLEYQIDWAESGFEIVHAPFYPSDPELIYYSSIMTDSQLSIGEITEVEILPDLDPTEIYFFPSEGNPNKKRVRLKGWFECMIEDSDPSNEDPIKLVRGEFNIPLNSKY